LVKAPTARSRLLREERSPGPFSETRLGPSANARSRQKVTPVPRAPRLASVSPEPASDSEGPAPSAPQSQPATTLPATAGPNWATCSSGRHKLSKAQDGRMCRCQRLKTSETEPPKTAHERQLSQDPMAPAHPVVLRRDATSSRNRSGSYAFRDVPAERRSSQASTTRLAMAASASFPHARGSYAFLLPTSPSTFSTPS
jgi:hypothetical protein